MKTWQKAAALLALGMAVIGGLESLIAAALGAIIIQFALEFLRTDITLGSLEIDMTTWRLVFFGLLLPSYFDVTKPVIPQALVMMVTITACEMFGLAVYAWLADAMNARFQSPTFVRWFNVGAAAAMFTAALIAAAMTTSLAG